MAFPIGHVKDCVRWPRQSQVRSTRFADKSKMGLVFRSPRHVPLQPADHGCKPSTVVALIHAALIYMRMGRHINFKGVLTDGGSQREHDYNHHTQRTSSCSLDGHIAGERSSTCF